MLLPGHLYGWAMSGRALTPEAFIAGPQQIHQVARHAHADDCPLLDQRSPLVNEATMVLHGIADTQIQYGQCVHYHGDEECEIAHVA